MRRWERGHDGSADSRSEPASFTRSRELLLQAIRPQEHLCELLRKRTTPSQYGGPLSAAEEQEEPWLRARFTKMAKAIGCPVGYGPRQAKNDRARIHQLYCKRISPPSCGGGPLPDAEDAEEAQLTARVAAFDESPEG
jgi:hypothetical protein